MNQEILRLPRVKQKSGHSRSTLYLRIAQGLWTKPVNLGARSVGWPLDEVNTLIAARIAGQSDDEIKDLVKSLHASRKQKMEVIKHAN